MCGREEQKGGFCVGLAIVFGSYCSPVCFPSPDVSGRARSCSVLLDDAPCPPAALGWGDGSPAAAVPAVSRGRSALSPIPALAPLPCAITIFLPVSMALLGWFRGAGAAGAALAGWRGRSPSPLVLGGNPELPLPFCTKGGGRAIPCSHTLFLLEPRAPGHVPAAPTPGPEGAKWVRWPRVHSGAGAQPPHGDPRGSVPTRSSGSKG